MLGGAAAVVTLLRPEDRVRLETEDQQFHVIPLYVPDCSKEDLNANVSQGGLVCLDKFQRTIAVRETKKANSAAGEEDFGSDTSLNDSTSFASDTSLDSTSV